MHCLDASRTCQLVPRAHLAALSFAEGSAIVARTVRVDARSAEGAWADGWPPMAPDKGWPKIDDCLLGANLPHFTAVLRAAIPGVFPSKWVVCISMAMPTRSPAGSNL